MGVVKEHPLTPFLENHPCREGHDSVMCGESESQWGAAAPDRIWHTEPTFT